MVKCNPCVVLLIVVVVNVVGVLHGVKTQFGPDRPTYEPSGHSFASMVQATWLRFVVVGYFIPQYIPAPKTQQTITRLLQLRRRCERVFGSDLLRDGDFSVRDFILGDIFLFISRLLPIRSIANNRISFPIDIKEISVSAPARAKRLICRECQ